jgi:integrase/recombinase XerD
VRTGGKTVTLLLHHSHTGVAPRKIRMKTPARSALTPNCHTVAEAKIRRVLGGRSRPAVVDEAAAWLATLLAQGASPRTCAVYRNALDALGAHLGDAVHAADITADDLVAWRGALAARGLAAATLDVYLRAVRTWFGWLEERGALFLNPAAGLVLPKVTRRLLPVPGAAELRRLLAAPNAATPFGVRDRALLETAYATGARREELVSLDATAVDLVNGTVRVVGKGRRERVLPLTRPAVAWLNRYTTRARPALLKGQLDEPALWIDLHGARLSPHGLDVVVKKHATAAKVRGVTPHTLRRACATHLLQGGAHVVFVQQLLGHATLRHLAHYLRMTIAELKATHARSKPGQ